MRAWYPFRSRRVGNSGNGRRRDLGAGLTEYLVLTCSVALCVIVSVQVFGDDLRAVFAVADNSLAGVDGSPATRMAPDADGRSGLHFGSSTRALNGADLATHSVALTKAVAEGMAAMADPAGEAEESATLSAAEKSMLLDALAGDLASKLALLSFDAANDPDDGVWDAGDDVADDDGAVFVPVDLDTAIAGVDGTPVKAVVGETGSNAPIFDLSAAMDGTELPVVEEGMAAQGEFVQAGGSSIPGIRVKSGARIANLTQKVRSTFPHIVSTWKQYTKSKPVITSGNDGRHGGSKSSAVKKKCGNSVACYRKNSDSAHYKNRAIDLRVNTFSARTQRNLAASLQKKVKPLGCSVLLELFPKSPANNHIHLQCG